MDIRTLTPDLSVSPQIAAADVPEIKAAGFRAILCNRPDGEGTDQPDYDEIALAAKEQGLEMAYQPVVSGQVSDRDAREFGEVVRSLPAPVLAYCRSGARSAMLWSLSEVGRRPVAEILATARAAGYDMSGVIR